ncbi:unnamed protein product [Allacma fusca]|uniref:Uncharacterized protein n=1 Tax=Allacma fusca TaxID=39272 RepID=A0A8J2KWI8_9HEXA|nr:unnamed protein product [Allacma fusca]
MGVWDREETELMIDVTTAALYYTMATLISVGERSFDNLEEKLHPIRTTHNSPSSSSTFQSLHTISETKLPPVASLFDQEFKMS